MSQPQFIDDGRRASGSYEYSAFDDLTFHVPDKSNPVIFELWKLGGAEPLYFWATHTSASKRMEKRYGST
jgi:hypothetical protein